MPALLFLRGHSNFTTSQTLFPAELVHLDIVQIQRLAGNLDLEIFCFSGCLDADCVFTIIQTIKLIIAEEIRLLNFYKLSVFLKLYSCILIAVAVN